MAFNGSGVFQRIYNWVSDKNASINITASRMDGEDDGFASGLSNCICRDGQSTISADIPWNSKKITGLGNATLDTDALNRITADGRYGRLVSPGGRLTLSSGVPVLTSTVSGSTSIKYTPYLNSYLWHYDGTIFAPISFSELSLTPTLAASSNYDVFSYLSGGVATLCIGPAWSTDTARGTGAGTTEITRVNGVWLNANNITSGPSAQRGTYLGSFRTNGSSTIDWITGGNASGGTAGVLGIFNAYNRVDSSAAVGNGSAPYSYSVAAWRSAFASTTNRVSVLRGLDEDDVRATYSNSIAPVTFPNPGYIGIGLDSTSAPAGQVAYVTAGSSAAYTPATSSYKGKPGLGFHYFQALEYAGGTTNFYGKDTVGQIAMLTVSAMA